MNFKSSSLFAVGLVGALAAGCGDPPLDEGHDAASEPPDAGMVVEGDDAFTPTTTDAATRADAFDPCARCSPNATCIADACECDPGFVGDGISCVAEVVGLSVLDAYIKADNTDADDFFGVVALSRDGNTLAIGAVGEDTEATGIDATSDERGDGNGAVYMYRRSGAGWAFETFLKPSNGMEGDGFGNALSLSDDGNTLAVGASLRGIGEGGSAYVFTRTGTTWTQQAHVFPEEFSATLLFGFSVSLSGDGNRLAVGLPGEDGRGTGVTTPPAPGALSLANSGAVLIYERTGTDWAMEAYVKASNTGALDNFGWSVAFSGDGNALVVGAPSEDSASTGVESTSNEGASGSGAAYVYRYTTAWAFESYLKASDVDAGDGFGTAVSIDRDGTTIAVGAPSYEFDSGGYDQSGAVFVFRRTSGWAEEDMIMAMNMGSDEGDLFGSSVSLSDDGDAFAAGAPGESSSLTGIGTSMNESASESGAVYLYRFADSSWTRESFIKASNTGAEDAFGDSVSLSGDGTRLAVGATGEDGSGTGVGSTSDELASDSGAAYVYR